MHVHTYYCCCEHGDVTCACPLLPSCGCDSMFFHAHIQIKSATLCKYTHTNMHTQSQSGMWRDDGQMFLFNFSS